ncbi:hypothetical protein NE237_023945 [Protea cynaroides]|uniref:Uncharacterized protein n=1 Tax=Protea cynaroides TaxID=273540 RepID=A0A9Q0K5N7_9MAGN|nr:hypothetical protein NE237_023945 [Protea cynaroides]
MVFVEGTVDSVQSAMGIIDEFSSVAEQKDPSFMGKKNTKKKTKEIREVVAEASSAPVIAETSEQQPQPRRKRGRPRKIIEKTQITDEDEEQKNQAAEEQKEEAVEEGDSKKIKSNEEAEPLKRGPGPSDQSKTLTSRRGRRKSQPRKSS